MKKKEQLEKQINRLKKIREDLGMNRTEFSQYMGIPLRTLEEWEAGRRTMPDYVLRLIAYFTRMERFLHENEIVYLDDYYTLKVDNSFITNKNDSGKIVSVNNKFFIGLAMVIKMGCKYKFIYPLVKSCFYL